MDRVYLIHDGLLNFSDGTGTLVVSWKLLKAA